MVMAMAGFGGQIGSGYGRSVCKGTKRGFNIRVRDSVGCNGGNVIGYGVIIDVGNEAGSGDNRGVKL